MMGSALIKRNSYRSEFLLQQSSKELRIKRIFGDRGLSDEGKEGRLPIFRQNAH
jgi:hypothetical protein